MIQVGGFMQMNKATIGERTGGATVSEAKLSCKLCSCSWDLNLMDAAVQLDRTI